MPLVERLTIGSFAGTQVPFLPMTRQLQERQPIRVIPPLRRELDVKPGVTQTYLIVKTSRRTSFTGIASKTVIAKTGKLHIEAGSFAQGTLFKWIRSLHPKPDRFQNGSERSMRSKPPRVSSQWKKSAPAMKNSPTTSAPKALSAPMKSSRVKPVRSATMSCRSRLRS